MLACPHVVLFDPQKSYSYKFSQEVVGLTIVDFSKHFSMFKKLPDQGYIAPDEMLKEVIAA